MRLRRITLAVTGMTAVCVAVTLLFVVREAILVEFYSRRLKRSDLQMQLDSIRNLGSVRSPKSVSAMLRLLRELDECQPQARSPLREAVKGQVIRMGAVAIPAIVEELTSQKDADHVTLTHILAKLKEPVVGAIHPLLEWLRRSEVESGCEAGVGYIGAGSGLRTGRNTFSGIYDLEEVYGFYILEEDSLTCGLDRVFKVGGCIGQMGEKAIGVLLQETTAVDDSTSIAGSIALGVIGRVDSFGDVPSSRVAEWIRVRLGSPNRAVVMAAVFAVGRTGIRASWVEDELWRVGEGADLGVRFQVIDALSRLGWCGGPGRGFLEAQLWHGNEAVRDFALWALSLMDGDGQ